MVVFNPADEDHFITDDNLYRLHYKLVPLRYRSLAHLLCASPFELLLEPKYTHIIALLIPALVFYYTCQSVPRHFVRQQFGRKYLGVRFLYHSLNKTTAHAIT